MIFNKQLLEIIACPSCKSRLTLTDDGQKLLCSAEKLLYPIDDGIPVLLEERAEPVDPNQ